MQINAHPRHGSHARCDEGNGASTEKLHAGLKDEQKKIADQLIGAHCGAM